MCRQKRSGTDPGERCPVIEKNWKGATKRSGWNTDKAFLWRNLPAAIVFPYLLYEKSFIISKMDRRMKNTKMRRSFYTKHFGIIL